MIGYGKYRPATRERIDGKHLARRWLAGIGSMNPLDLEL